jgi:hypothetical protein
MPSSTNGSDRELHQQLSRRRLFLENYMKFSFAQVLAALTGGTGRLRRQGPVRGGQHHQQPQHLRPGAGNNGGDDLPVAAGATSFAFSKQIDYGTTYNITVKTQPAHMTCSVSAGSASAGHNVSIQAA